MLNTIPLSISIKLYSVPSITLADFSFRQLSRVINFRIPT